MPTVRVLLTVLAVAVLADPSISWSAEHPALARARVLYNAGDFDAAIESATQSLPQTESRDASSLVIARAHLERYRVVSQASELAAAREALSSLQPARLSDRDRLDLLVGLGQLLFFGERFGAAAELFDAALDGSSVLAEGDRRQLLDWWASALDRDAQLRPFHLRGITFDRITSRMEEELRRDPGCAPANYWLAVSARGSGDVDRAWNAAVAGWVRAFLVPETTASLRADLDRLVTQALIPERVLARPLSEQPDAQALLSAEWDLVKEQWK